MACPARSQEVSAAPDAQSAVKTLDANGATLHYSERGSGPLLVLVHGSLGELSDWDTDANALGTNHRVLAYSRRFHEPNAAPRAGQAYSMRQHAEDLAALIRANGGKADVVAHSYGAYTSLYMALLHPELVRTLVLAEPPILPWLKESEPGRTALAEFQKSTLTPSRNAFDRGDLTDGMRQFLNGVSGHPVFDQMPAEARIGVMRAAPEMRAEMTTDPKVYMPPITCAQVRRFNHPVLILTGEKSPPFFHIIADRLQACLSNAQTISIPGASHGGIVSSPAFVPAIEQFLGHQPQHGHASGAGTANGKH